MLAFNTDSLFGYYHSTRDPSLCPLQVDEGREAAGD